MGLLTTQELTKEIDQTVKALAEGVSTTQASEKFQEWLSYMAKFHKYSWGNSILIAFQRPRATLVKGYRQWQKVGRQVQKGEKAIKILAPMKVKYSLEDDDGNEYEKARLVGFKPVNVFDVSQTEGDPVPKMSWQGEGTSEPLEQAMIAFATTKNIKVEKEDLGGPLGASLKGKILYSGVGNIPRILAHELAHEIENPETDREPLVDAVAAVVCMHFGIDMIQESATYISVWQGSVDTLRQNMSYIQRMSSIIIEGVEENARV